MASQKVAFPYRILIHDLLIGLQDDRDCINTLMQSVEASTTPCQSVKKSGQTSRIIGVE
jgi:hypothetical protein